MSEALIEFFVLGQIPGTDFTIGYRTSLFIAGSLVVSICLYATLRYRHYLSRQISELSPDQSIELKSI